MSCELLEETANALAWSLWTELGAPGLTRDHTETAIDPEALIVATPSLAAKEPRLLDLAMLWCMEHAHRLNTTRLQGLLKLLPDEAIPRFHAFAATFNANTGGTWPSGGLIASPGSPSPREIPIPWDRPALLRLRARALFGVGTRADVICDLLAQPEQPVTAEDLSGGGHTKRNVARILADLADAGTVQDLREGNARSFRLSDPHALARVLGGIPDDLPAWTPILNFTLLALRLRKIQDLPPSARRVEAHMLREALAPSAQRLHLEAPPQTKGDPAAWDQLLDWATAQVQDLAEGRSTALTGPVSPLEGWSATVKLLGIARDRPELRVSLTQEGARPLRVLCSGWDLDMFSELFRPGARMRIVGTLRRDRRLRPRLVERLTSIELLRQLRQVPLPFPETATLRTIARPRADVAR